MQYIEAVTNRMREEQEAIALFWHGREYSYGEFNGLIDAWGERI